MKRRLTAAELVALVKDAREIAGTGKMSARDVGRLSLAHHLCFASTCRYLEEARILPRGTYTVISQSNVRVRDIYAAAKKEPAK